MTPRHLLVDRVGSTGFASGGDPRRASHTISSACVLLPVRAEPT